MTQQTMTVDLSELDAWSGQVERASRDLEGIGRNASSRLAPSDFGPILEVMTGAYNALLPQVHQTLEQDARRVRDHGDSLAATARDFTHTEEGVVQRHQGVAVDGRDGSTSFRDVADTAVRVARPTEGELPQVSFGFPFDTVCDLIRMFTGFDIRSELAEKIGGDVVGASTQGAALGHLGASVSGVADNLRSGAESIGSTWTGEASDSARSAMSQWVGLLDQQAGTLVEMGENLVTTCRNAWQTAQSVVQCITSAVQTVSAALATAGIPGIGWARIARAVMQAFQAVMKAFQVLTRFIALLKQVKGYIEGITRVFDADSLPTATATEGPSGGPSSVVGRPEDVAAPVIGHPPAAPATA